MTMNVNNYCITWKTKNYIQTDVPRNLLFLIIVNLQIQKYSTFYCKLVKVQMLCILCNNWCLFRLGSMTPDLSLASFYTYRGSSFLARVRQTVLYIITETDRVSYWVYHYDTFSETILFIFLFFRGFPCFDLRQIDSVKLCKVRPQITRTSILNKIKYSQICVQRQPLGQQNSGRYWQVVVVDRWLLFRGVR